MSIAAALGPIDTGINLAGLISHFFQQTFALPPPPLNVLRLLPLYSAPPPPIRD